MKFGEVTQNMNNIPEHFQGSKGLQLIQSQGWNFKVTGTNEIVLEHCFKCQKEWHLHMEVRGPQDTNPQRDGLWLCMKCGSSGNLYALKQHLGLVSSDISSQKEWAKDYQKIDALPDIQACHLALLADDDAMEYLCLIRGFSLEIIKQQKIGLTKHYFKSAGETRALVFPYLVNGNPIWVHYRTLPDPKDLKKIPKDFASPKGYESQLYQGEHLKDGLKEITIFEGEMNTLCALSNGLTNVFGVPGANIKKAAWIEAIERIGIEKVYICYDNDKAGNKAAQIIASRIGIQQCYKVVLPNFQVTTESGESRNGKDINEWFQFGGGTKELFEQLKSSANQFDVDGVSGTSTALGEFEEELDNKGAGQKYNWPLLNNIVQFDEGDCIHILASEKTGKSKTAMNMLEYMIDTYKEDGVFICLEMTRAKLARMWASHKTGVADVVPKTPEEALELTTMFKQAIPELKNYVANREGEIYFCYPKYQTSDDVINLILDCIRRYGVKWIVLDNLQRLCDTTIGPSKNRTQYLSELSKRISQICKDYNVQIIVILQPNRVAENKLTHVNNVDGASHIAKDCDVMLVLNRHRINEIDKETFEKGSFIQTDSTFGPEMLIEAGLSRYSAGGSTTVWFDGATSTIMPLTLGKIKSMNDSAKVGYEAQAEKQNFQLLAASQNPTNEGINI